VRVEQRQFGDDLHAASAAGVEALVDDVGADVGVALLDQDEMGFVRRERGESVAVAGDIGAFHRQQEGFEVGDGFAVDGAGAGA